MTPKVSIIIVDYKKADKVLKNVGSLASQDVNFDIELVVVDNSCDPENAAKLKTLREYQGVRVIINEKNRGYIRGNNQGAVLATGKYLLFVNPDIVWSQTNTLQKMVDFMEYYRKVGIAGPKQINQNDRSIAMTIRAFPKLPLQIARRTFLRHIPGVKQWVEYDEMRHLNYEEAQTVDWLQSSFWIVRKELWDKLGGLSKDYFLFMSDPDLCFRCWEAGYEVVYFPEAQVQTDGLRASAGGFTDFLKKWPLRQHLKEAVTYSIKHFMRGNPHARYIDSLPSEEVKSKTPEPPKAPQKA
ncbi:MAG: glycosyltransferase family 2 protein [Candidatus Peregrinibacteria bacterium]